MIALAQGITPATFDSATAGIAPIPSIAALNANQPEFSKPVWSYLDSAVSARRIRDAQLMLARYGREGATESTIPKVSQETLASMVGTTRSRISFFMNKFRKLGFIKYNGSMQVHGSLLNVLLHDQCDARDDMPGGGQLKPLSSSHENAAS